MNIENIINHALHLDARSPSRLKKLQKKYLLISVQLKNKDKNFHLQFSESGLHFLETPGQTPEVIIKGPLRAFLNLAFNKNPQSAARLGLNFEGDLATLEAIQTLFLSLDIDWEELLSHWTGDIIAHQIGNFIGYAKTRKTEVLQATTESLGAYLKESPQQLPAPSEINAFISDIDQLRSAVDRLEARVARLGPLLNRETS